MNAPLPLWVARALWLALPFTLLEHLASATSDADGATSAVVQAMFWALWAIGLAASMVALPVALTAVRLLAPAAPAASIAASVAASPGPVEAAGLVAGSLAAALAMGAPVGDWFVDGPSYGDERRLALRPPGALLLGPLELTWLLGVVPLPTGILLIASGSPVAGALVAAAGLATAWWAFLATNRLAHRWAVFVPAGLTLVDDMALAEPVLLRAGALARLGPAHLGTGATDLTVAAPGLVIEADLTAPLEVVPAPSGRGGVAEALGTAAVLFVPSRPATLLDVAEARGMPVARD